MTQIISFSQALKNKQFHVEQQKAMKQLEMLMSDTLVNIEELQFLAFRDLELLGIESFEIISAELISAKQEKQLQQSM